MYKKISKGRTYWYLREVYRAGGKVRVKWQKYLGTPETILSRIEQAEKADKPLRQRTESFGGLFVAHALEKELDTIGIIDAVVPRSPKETGPSVGEYFFYAWANRMIAPKSKRALEKWYRETAIQHIRPVDLSQLSSERYWEKWDRVSKEQVEKIGALFVSKLWKHREQGPETVLFDTTNYFTYMATKTKSDLAVRGHNKSGKHHLRQIGLGLLIDRATSLPIHYKLYPGNLHDSKVFEQTLDEMFGILMGFADNGKTLTVVFDKGMNSKDNLALIDGQNHVYFITTYSTYFAEHLAGLDPKHFAVLDMPKNRRLKAKERSDDMLSAFRTTMEIWGRERTVIVTFNPVTRRKKLYGMSKKLDRIRAELIQFRQKYRDREAQWRDSKVITTRYRKLCEELHISHKFYTLSFADQTMSFRKNNSEINAAKALMGKNLIVTDHHDWSSEAIVMASLDRYRIEQQFRASKAPCHVRINPVFHWTDSKIRCHLLTCVLALSSLRLLELKFCGPESAKTIMEGMASLDCILSWRNGSKMPSVHIEEPNEFQTRVLAALGYEIKAGSVLQIQG
jgi:transposase